MKKFTKLLSLILIFVLAMGVTACSSCENESSYDKLTKYMLKNTATKDKE